MSNTTSSFPSPRGRRASWPALSSCWHTRCGSTTTRGGPRRCRPTNNGGRQRSANSSGNWSDGPRRPAGGACYTIIGSVVAVVAVVAGWSAFVLHQRRLQQHGDGGTLHRRRAHRRSRPNRHRRATASCPRSRRPRISARTASTRPRRRPASRTSRPEPARCRPTRRRSASACPPTRATSACSSTTPRRPCTVNSFASLAQQGYFNDTPCHRLTTSPGLSVLQCGDPTGSGQRRPWLRVRQRVPDQPVPAR